MSSASGKKEFFYIVVLILTFITVVIGATYALYYWIFSQEEGSSAVYTGTLSIEYLSGDIISSHYLKPTYEPTFDTVDNIYRNNFRVTNTGSLDSLIDIVVKVNKNEFSDDILMYSLYKEGEEINNGYIYGNNDFKLATGLTLESNEESDFVLIIWLSESGEVQNSEMRKSFTGQIKIDASHKRD